MRIVLLGGTGAIGQHLSKILQDNGHEVFVTSRSAHHSDGGVRYMVGDAHDLLFLEKILIQKFDVIVDFMVYRTNEFEKRVERFLESAKQYVFMSSARVYDNNSLPLKECSPKLLDNCRDWQYLSTDEYALAKARQERVLENSKRKNWTIIRPYISYAENRLQLGVLEKEEWLWRALCGRTIVFSQDIASKLTTLTYGKDVAQAIANVVGRTDAMSTSFHIAQNESIQWLQLLDIYLNILEKKLGYRPKVLITEKSTNSFNKYRKWQVLKDRIYNRRFDSKKILTFSQNLEFLHTEEGLTLCLNKFLMSPKFKQINLKQEALFDKLTHECANSSDFDDFYSYGKYLIYRYLLPQRILY